MAQGWRRSGPCTGQMPVCFPSPFSPALYRKESQFMGSLALAEHKRAGGREKPGCFSPLLLLPVASPAVALVLFCGSKVPSFMTPHAIPTCFWVPITACPPFSPPPKSTSCSATSSLWLDCLPCGASQQSYHLCNQCPRLDSRS